MYQLIKFLKPLHLLTLVKSKTNECTRSKRELVRSDPSVKKNTPSKARHFNFGT